MINKERDDAPILEASVQGNRVSHSWTGREDRRLVQIDSQTVLVEYGPIRMTIQILHHGRPLIDLALEGGQIASAVTVVAENAALADAAATVMVNATRVEDPVIKRCLPETIYPDTDIPGEDVTAEVGELPVQKIEEALQKGLQEALRIERHGHIRGALIPVKGSTVWTESMNAWLTKL